MTLVPEITKEEVDWYQPHRKIDMKTYILSYGVLLFSSSFQRARIGQGKKFEENKWNSLCVPHQFRVRFYRGKYCYEVQTEVLQRRTAPLTYRLYVYTKDTHEFMSKTIECRSIRLANSKLPLKYQIKRDVNPTLLLSFHNDNVQEKIREWYMAHPKYIDSSVKDAAKLWLCNILYLNLSHRKARNRAREEEKDEPRKRMKLNNCRERMGEMFRHWKNNNNNNNHDEEDFDNEDDTVSICESLGAYEKPIEMYQELITNGLEFDPSNGTLFLDENRNRSESIVVETEVSKSDGNDGGGDDEQNEDIWCLSPMNRLSNDVLDEHFFVDYEPEFLE